MKIIVKNRIIELPYEEFQRMNQKEFERLLLLKTVKAIEVKEGSGNYKHKSKLTDIEKQTIKTIHQNYPQRSDRSIAKELNEHFKTDKFTRDLINYWRQHG